MTGEYSNVLLVLFAKLIGSVFLEMTVEYCGTCQNSVVSIVSHQWKDLAKNAFIYHYVWVHVIKDSKSLVIEYHVILNLLTDPHPRGLWNCTKTL